MPDSGQRPPWPAPCQATPHFRRASQACLKLAPDQEERMPSRTASATKEIRQPFTGHTFLRPLTALVLTLQSLHGWSDSAIAQSLHFTRLKSTTATCTEAQSSVQSELRSRGFFSPYRANAGSRIARMVYPAITLDSTSIGKYYFGAPAGRPQQLDINLSGDSNKLYQGLLSSPVYLSALGARIMEACPDIGLVSFNHWHEGGVPVGFFPDGTARTFQWVDLGEGPHTRLVPGADGMNVMQYQWGYYFSP